jgi:hypothetical protein
MRPLLSVIVFAALLSACSDQPQRGDSAPAATSDHTTALSEMPEAFQGQWDFAEEDCAVEVSEMRLTIEAGRVAFYESSADLSEIRQTSDRDITVTHGFSGEGQEWQEILAYQLSADGERLTVTTVNGSFSTRVRCPG